MRAVEAAGANVTVILIAPTGWATGAWARDGLTLPPGVEVEFPAYAHADAVAVLARSPPTASPAAAATVPGTGDVAAAFEAMLGACVLPTFGRDTVDLDALRHAAAWLWPLYAAPGVDGGRRSLAAAAAAARPALVAARAALDAGLPLPEVRPRGDGDGGASMLVPADAAAHALDLELPYTAKFLLLAAHVSSLNRETADRRLFDPTYRAPKRRATAARAVGAAGGPGTGAGSGELATFPAERLLAVFWHICAAEGAPSPDESADVMAQLASLVSLGLLARSRDGAGAHGGALDAARYSSRVPAELAARVARNVRVDLGAYIIGD